MSDEYFEEDSEIAQIRGYGKSKPKMSLLNQKNVSKWEMDELFSEDDEFFDES